jgi:hypothetical protein
LNIHYEGYYGVGTRIHVACDLQREETEFDIPFKESSLFYETTRNGHVFAFENLTSKYVCPYPFIKTETLTEPRPTPDPDYEPDLYFEEEVNGEIVWLDLEELDPHGREVIVGFGHDFEDCEIYFSPAERTGCPAGRKCGVYESDKANIWKCVNDKKDCYPIGDSAYGLTWSVANKSEIWAGIRAEYAGGAENTTTVVHFMCYDAFPPGMLQIDQVAREYHMMSSHIELNAYTKNACPGFEQPSEVKGGAIFLLVMAALGVVYLIGGTVLMLIWKGSIAIPFQNFWKEVFESLKTAVYFIFCCGKSPAASSQPSYDKM